MCILWLKTGIGIPENMLEVIFDKFMQADMSVSRKYGGTGLGLAISKSLAEIMGGSITVKSKVRKGSEFTLHLSLERAEDFSHVPYPKLIVLKRVKGRRCSRLAASCFCRGL